MIGSPALGPWIARDPVNARIARHDYDNLGLIDQAWSAFIRGSDDSNRRPAGMRSDQMASAEPQAPRHIGADESARRAAFNALGDRVAGLTMARLSSDKTQEVVRSIVRHGGPRAVLVPVRDVQEHLGALPRAEAEARARTWGVDDLLRGDVDTDGDLVTPTETYLARLHSEAGEDIGRNIRFAQPRSLGHCMGECAKTIARGDHYASPSEWARDLTYLGAAAGAPFPKKWLGPLGKIVGDASHYTNLYSASRFLFPKNEQRKRLTMPRRLLNTKSIPGFVGKVSGFTAVPFIGYDAVHFGGCMGDCLGNPRPEDIEVPPHA